ncbi:conserved hypothetical protein [Capnocytophaga canimorsus]|uniref:Uncharacterized protein n=2 Tax=Flavobacteriaceae TaxID=49546 RepID=A0A0B7INL8_9FLAO|nr:conserved hypothetical protein [Capnocytophaga canimorsus]
MRKKNSMEKLENEFYNSLKEMEHLAISIDFEGFANIFRKGCKILENQDISIKERLIKAYNITNVFGGMGSWNDSPPCYAHAKGIIEKYYFLTDQFYEIRKKVELILNENG